MTVNTAITKRMFDKLEKKKRKERTKRKTSWLYSREMFNHTLQGFEDGTFSCFKLFASWAAWGLPFSLCIVMNSYFLCDSTYPRIKEKWYQKWDQGSHFRFHLCLKSRAGSLPVNCLSELELFWPEPPTSCFLHSLHSTKTGKQEDISIETSSWFPTVVFPGYYLIWSITRQHNTQRQHPRWKITAKTTTGP